jgi:hypothetical protein
MRFKTQNQFKYSFTFSYFRIRDMQTYIFYQNKRKKVSQIIF